MRKSILWGAPAAVISVATLSSWALDHHLSVIPKAQAQGLREALCPRGNATLHGAYMSKGGGTVVGVGPVAFIGTIYYDGKGGNTNPFTASFGGQIGRLEGTATYTINPDCSGRLTSSDDTQHYDFRVSPDGSKVDYIETDAGTIISGSASRISAGD